MQIIYKNINELIDYDKNARIHSDEQIDQLANSMTKFKFTDPIEIGSDNVIISGHARLAAAKRLGLTNVPCIVQSHLEGSERDTYVLAANKIAMNAQWDYSILTDRLESLTKEEQLLTGFTKDELCDLLEDKNFEAGQLSDQGKLDKLEPVWVECPQCSHEFDAREQL